jgi:hypothetical protein
MPSFMTQWLKRKYNLQEEVDTVYHLIYRKADHGYSITYLVNESFLRWELRNNTVSIDDFEKKSHIDKCISLIRNNPYDDSFLDCVLSVLEYAFNLAGFVRRLTNKEGTYYQNSYASAGAIIENISKIVEQIGYQIKDITDLPGKPFVFIPVDVIADMASDVVEGIYNLDEDIFMYRHHSMNGDLVGKADILARMEKYVEGEIEPNIKGVQQFKTILDNIGFMANTLDIRHAPKAEKKPIIDKLKAEGKLEIWYDDLYRQIISVIVLYDCFTKQKDIDALKKSV